MGSRLSRQGRINNETKFSKRRLQRHSSYGETGASVNQDRRDFTFSSLIRRSDKLPGMLRKTSQSPYMRRAAWIGEIQNLLRDHKVEQAGVVLRLLRKDMGLEGTAFSDILYKNAAFLNLVDPISHELLLSLARDMQCPKKDSDFMKSSEKICRQLIYHLTPHSKWVRQGTPRRKSQACLKTMLQKKLSNGVVDLSGIPLSSRDVHRVAYYLQKNGNAVTSVDLSFTELQDESLRLLLPFLATLPKLATLALNGNRLTAGVLKDVTEAAKDTSRFPSLAWVDLGNNVNILTTPQPLLVALRRRFGLRSTLPTIYEYSKQAEDSSSEEEDEQEEEEQQDGDEEKQWGAEEAVLKDICCER